MKKRAGLGVAIGLALGVYGLVSLRDVTMARESMSGLTSRTEGVPALAYKVNQSGTVEAVSVIIGWDPGTGAGNGTLTVLNETASTTLGTVAVDCDAAIGTVTTDTSMSWAVSAGDILKAKWSTGCTTYPDSNITITIVAPVTSNATVENISGYGDPTVNGTYIFGGKLNSSGMVETISVGTHTAGTGAGSGTLEVYNATTTTLLGSTTVDCDSAAGTVTATAAPSWAVTAGDVLKVRWNGGCTTYPESNIIVSVAGTSSPPISHELLTGYLGGTTGNYNIGGRVDGAGTVETISITGQQTVGSGAGNATLEVYNATTRTLLGSTTFDCDGAAFTFASTAAPSWAVAAGDVIKVRWNGGCTDYPDAVVMLGIDNAPGQ